MVKTVPATSKAFLLNLAADTFYTSWELIKITVPVVIITKILEELGLITVFSTLLAPVMELLGLPGELGLVWATSIITTLYGGMAVFATLAPGLDLTVAQVTILCSAMLLAHSLPIEMSVTKKAGGGLFAILFLRLGGALCYCFLLNLLCGYFGIWQQKATFYFTMVDEKASWLQWSYQQAINIGLIIVIIFCIILFMHILRRMGIISLLEKLLGPILPLFGMTNRSAPITVVGMIMGLGYGGALIIREVQKTKLDKRQVFHSLALMGLCHGLIEDTLLMVALGGRLGGIFWGRIAFSLIVIYIMVRCLDWFAAKKLKQPAE